MHDTLVYRAKKFVTMNDEQPLAEAVAVRDGRFIALGSFDEVVGAIGPDYEVSDCFVDRTVLPGLIDQHLHPMLGATTLTTEIIAPEDWNLPRRFFPAAVTEKEFDERLRYIHASLPENEWLFTWGWHHLWHGKLDRQRLDALVGNLSLIHI